MKIKTVSRAGAAVALSLLCSLGPHRAIGAEEAFEEIDGVEFHYWWEWGADAAALGHQGPRRAVYMTDGRKMLKIPQSTNGKRVTKIEEEACRHLPDVEEIALPEGITEIGRSAFRECWSLKKINIPSSVRWIGDSAFEECESLKSITLPKNVKLGQSAVFKNCRSLETFEFPEGTRFGFPNDADRDTLNDYFAGCSSLRAIKIPPVISVVGNGTFDGCEALTRVDLPPNLKTMEYAAFRGCKSLETIDVPESVVEIGDLAFNGCSRLKAIKLPYRIKKIGGGGAIEGGTFADCTSLREIAVPENVTEIGMWAFRNCFSLQKVVFSPEIQRIRVQDGAFYGCTSLKEIVLPRGIEKSVLDAKIDTKDGSKQLRELPGLKITYND